MRGEYLRCAVVINSVGCFDLTRKSFFEWLCNLERVSMFCLVTFQVGMVI